MNMHHTSFFFFFLPEQPAHPAGREALSLPGGSPLSGSPRQRTPPSPAEYEQCERCVNKWPFSCHGIRALRIYWCRHPNGSCKETESLPSFFSFPEPQPRLSFLGSSLPAPFVRPYVQVQRLMKLLQEREERFDQYLGRERK